MWYISIGSLWFEETLLNFPSFFPLVVSFQGSFVSWISCCPWDVFFNFLSKALNLLFMLVIRKESRENNLILPYFEVLCLQKEKKKQHPEPVTIHCQVPTDPWSLLLLSPSLCATNVSIHPVAQTPPSNCLHIPSVLTPRAFQISPLNSIITETTLVQPTSIFSSFKVIYSLLSPSQPTLQIKATESY